MTDSDEQVRQFEQVGAVTFDGPFPPAQIQAVSDLVARLDAEKKLGGYADYFVEPLLVDVIQHPFFEEAAKRFLHAPEVEFVNWAARQKGAQPGQVFALDGEHVDVSYHRLSLESVPRRMLVSFWLWLTDVTIDRGPFMFRPGSHRQIAEHWGDDGAHAENPLMSNQLPALAYAEPVPVLAKAGQVSALTTATVHSGSVNTGTQPRRAMVINYQPRGHEVRFNMIDAAKRVAHLRELRAAMRPERRRLIPLKGNVLK